MRRPEEALQRALVAQLRARLLYDPSTGNFTWAPNCRARIAGRVAGSLHKKGYRQIQIVIGGKLLGFKAHRLAWLFTHGEWPSEQIDHINGERDDNRIENLRLATPSQNMANRKLNANNAAGAKGVCFHKGAQRWRARLQVNGTRIHLGDFKNKEAAEIAYAVAAKMHFGDYARLK